MKCFDAVLFVSQYRTSINKNGFFSSNKLGVIMADRSSSGRFTLIIKTILKRILHYN